MNFSNPLHGKRKPGSIGLPLPKLEVRTVDPETGKDVPPGQTGEFWLRGPAVTPGYWRKPAETAEAFEKAVDINARFSWYQFRLGHTYRMQGRYEEAVEVFLRIPELDGTPPI